MGAVVLTNLASDDSTSASAELTTLDVPQHVADELDDGSFHFVVRVSPAKSDTTALGAPATTRRMVLDENGQPTIVTIGGTSTVAANPSLGDHDEITEATAIGADLYAVTTTLNARDLAAIPGVTEVVDDVAMSTLGRPSSAAAAASYEVLQWALENTGQKISGPAGLPDADIDAPIAWPHTTGAGVVVAVIDTGVDADHPDIEPNLWVNTAEDCTNGTDDDNNGFVDDCHGWDFAHDDASIDDTDGNDRHDHGTHIAGVIAAPRDSVGTTGVAPGAAIMVLKVIEHQAFWMTDAVRAIDYAVANGAQIINISWGTTPSTAQADVDALESALSRAEAAGVVIVAAAGNEAVDIDSKPVQPASLPNAGLITVAATTNTDQKASFSAFGPGTVDIFAPGEDVAGPITDEWAFMGGSSVAAAHVSGAAALVLERWPTMTPAAVRQLLVDTADQIPALEGLAKQPARLNVGNLFAVDQPAALVLFDGFDTLQPAMPAPLTVQVARQNAGAQLAVQATLLARIDGEVHAVLGLPITAAGVAAVTDQSGQFDLGQVMADETIATLQLTTTLPAGEFALIVELVDDSSDLAVQAPQAVFFDVAPDAADGDQIEPDDGGSNGDDIGP